MPNKVDTHKSPMTTLVERAEELGWCCNQDVQDGKCYIEFFQASPAGEDFGFTAYGDTVEEIVKDIREYADDFDAEEHVKELLDAKANGFAGVPDVFTLVEDAKAIQEMLNTLAWDDALCGNEQKDFTLRKKIEDAKAEYMERYGELGWQYTDEGLPYAIQDYHGSVGSVMDFTADDWLACKESGWTLDEVCKLCDEEQFGSDVDTLAEFIRHMPDDMPKEDALCAVEDFYTWRNELLLTALKAYATSGSWIPMN
jgi:hypothetical protein